MLWASSFVSTSRYVPLVPTGTITATACEPHPGQQTAYSVLAPMTYESSWLRRRVGHEQSPPLSI